MVFYLQMKPPTVTAQEKKIATRNGKPVVYSDDRLRDARAKFEAYLSAHSPQKPLTGPILLHTRWNFPVSTSHHDGEYKTTKPDTDNSVKLFKDCMTRCGFWKDDAQVAVEIVEKYYANIPGILVRVEELP